MSRALSREERQQRRDAEVADQPMALSWAALLSCCGSSASSSRADEDPRTGRAERRNNNSNSAASSSPVRSAKKDDPLSPISSSSTSSTMPSIAMDRQAIRVLSNDQATDAFINDIMAGGETVLPTAKWRYREVFEDKNNPNRHLLIPPQPSSSTSNHQQHQISSPLANNGAAASLPPRTVLGSKGMQRVVSAFLNRIEERDLRIRRSQQQPITSSEPFGNITTASQASSTPSQQAAAAALARTPAHSVSVLDLSKQCIGDEGAVALGALIARDTQITTINISNNFISGRGIVAIADGIRRNCGSLQKISLADNDIDNQAAVSLFNAIKELRYRLAESSARNNSSINNSGRVGLQWLEVGFSSPDTLMAVMAAQQASAKELRNGASVASSGGGSTNNSSSRPPAADHSRLHLSDDACIALSEACFCSADGFASLSSQQCIPFTLKSLKIVNSPLSFTASSLGALLRGASSAVWAAPDEQPSNGQYHVSWTYSSANRGSTLSPRDGPLCELSLVNCIDFGPLRSNENGIKAFTVPLCQSVLSPPLAHQQHALLSGGGLRQLELHHLPLSDAGVQDIFAALIANERTKSKIVAAQMKYATPSPASKTPSSASLGGGGGLPPLPPSSTILSPRNGPSSLTTSFAMDAAAATGLVSGNGYTGLSSISLSRSRFYQPYSIMMIADFIALNPSLRRLDVSYCYAVPHGRGVSHSSSDHLLTPLWNALASNKTLQSIDITGFPVTYEDLSTLCDILVQGLNTTLLALDFSPPTTPNGMGGAAAAAMVDISRTLMSCLQANASGGGGRGGGPRRGYVESDNTIPNSARGRRRSLSRGLSGNM